MKKSTFLLFAISFCLWLTSGGFLPRHVSAGPAVGVELGVLSPLGQYARRLENGPGVKLFWQFPAIFLADFEHRLSLGIFTHSSLVSDQNSTFFPLAYELSYPVSLGKSFSLSPLAGAGFYQMSAGGGQSVTQGLSLGGLRAEYSLFSDWKIGLSVDYQYYHDGASPMHALSIRGGVAFHYGSQPTGDLEVSLGRLEEFFAAEYMRYFSHPAGEITLRNRGQEPLSQMAVSLYSADYMDKPSRSSYILPVLRPGAEAVVPVYAFFNKNLLTGTSRVNAPAVLEISYQDKQGKSHLHRKNLFLAIEPLNSLRWDRLSRLGSFITLEDPVLLDFSRKAIRLAGSGEELPPALDKALKIFLAVVQLGVRYVEDPKAGYRFFYGGRPNTDYIQLPRQTLGRKTGDCDDFTVLFSALYEGAGIKTAVAATPGHIFLLVEMPQGKLPSLVSFEGRKWLPLELTALNEGFLAAWAKGYAQYQASAEKEVKSIAEMVAEYPPLVPQEPFTLSAVLKAFDLEEAYKKTAAEIRAQSGK